MKKIIFHALLLGAAALGSCSEELETDVFGISGNTIQFSVNGGTQTLAVDVKCDCTLSCDADWIVCSPQYVEAGKSELTIEAAENPEFKAREATILLASEELNLTRTIAVRQEGIIPYINCESKIEATYKSGTYTIEVQSNIPWKASSQADWLTFSPNEGAAGTTKLSIKLPMLSADQKTRQGEIVLINTEYNITKKITIKQTSESPFINCSHDHITVEYYDKMFPATIEANIPWEASCDADWIIAFPFGEDGIFIKSWLETGTRRAEIIVSNAEYRITKKITVEQTGLSDKNQLITYTTADNKRISIKEYAFDASLLLHEYNSDTQTYTLVFDQIITKIGYGAFWGCRNLTSIMIPNSVTEIGYDAFQNCSSLTSITIPDGVMEIRDYAFENCTNLTSIYCKPQTPPDLGSLVFGNIASSAKIYVPTASVEAYKSASDWSMYASMIVGYDF